MIDNIDYQLADTSASAPLAAYKEISFYTPSDIIEKESKNEILANLLLTWAGCYTKAYGHLVSKRLLQDYVMIYCVEGLGWLELHNKRWIISKGDVFVCPPGMVHSYGADTADPWTKYWVHFRGENAGSYMAMLGLSPDCPVLHLGENMKVISWLQDIFTIVKTGYTHSNLIFATSYLANILSYIYSLSVNTGLANIESMNVEKVIHYMLDNIDGNLSLEQLSQYSNLSRCHFIRLFKKKAGYTPMNYYIRLKVQKACELLESSTAKINRISGMLGFNNPYYFSITFKRIVGHSPQAYRDIVQNKTM